MFELEQFCLDCRKAMKETDPQRAVREIVAREVAEHILLGRGLTMEEAYAPLIQEWDKTDVMQ